MVKKKNDFNFLWNGEKIEKLKIYGGTSVLNEVHKSVLNVCPYKCFERGPIKSPLISRFVTHFSFPYIIIA